MRDFCLITLRGLFGDFLKGQPNPMIIPRQSRRRRRQAFLLIEMLVAMAFLVVAIGAVLKMHQARIDYDRIAMDRLRNQLAVENVGEELVSISYSDLSAAASGLTKDSGVQVKVDPFEYESQNGLHVIVQMDSAGGPLTHHVWRLEPKS